MSKKTININCNKRNFFKQYLQFLSPLLDLRKQEVLVFAELLYHNNELKHIDEKNRYKLLFDYDIKTDIRYSISKPPMNVNSFYNIISSLKKKGYIGDNTINKKYEFFIDDEFDLNINWKCKES